MAQLEQIRETRSNRARATVTAVFASAAIGLSAPGGAQAVTIAQHPLSGGASAVTGIAAVAGGLAVTRAVQSSTVLARITTAPFAAGPLQPLGAIALGSGPDGQLWLCAVTSNAGAVELERDPAGGGLEPRFAFPLTLGTSFWPEQFATAPDGSLWIANMTAGAIERLSPQGALSTYPLPRGGAPTSIAVAPDGSVWTAEPVTGSIGELGVGGGVSEHELAGTAPGAFGNAEPFSIVLGPDGALWFTEEALGRIGRISTNGDLHEFAIPNTSGVAQGEYGSPAPRYITTGPDGALWFTDGGDESIGRITTAGQVSEYPIGSAKPSSPEGIVSAGGELWFAESGLDALGSVDPNGQQAPPPASASSRPHTAARSRRCTRDRPASRRRSTRAAKRRSPVCTARARRRRRR